MFFLIYYKYLQEVRQRFRSEAFDRRTMEAKAIVTYVVCDDTIKNLKLQDDTQSRISTAEVMTTAIISAIQYSGNIEKARITFHHKAQGLEICA